MATFKGAIEVSVPDFSLEELSEIVKYHDTDEVMRALGYERKINTYNPVRVQTKSTHLYQDTTVKVKVKVLGYKKDYLGSTDKYPTVTIKKVFK